MPRARLAPLAVQLELSVLLLPLAVVVASLYYEPENHM